MAERFLLPRPDDFHVHLRRGPALAAYARREAASFGRCLAMPNTLPPLVDGEGLRAYREEIAAAAPGLGYLPAFKLLPGMGAETVRACAAAGALAGKLYPAGATTNSADGVRDPAEIAEALSAMEERGLVLSIHAEDPAAPLLEREAAWLPAVDRILADHPRLRVVVEHLSSREGLAFVLSGPERLGATVTAHHLLFTLDDLMGEALDPWLHCKPCLKTARDRDALRDAIFRGEPRLFFGSDSAPHPRAAKESGSAPSGVYAAPTALPALAGLFAAEAGIGRLLPFVAGRGAAFYGLAPPAGGLLLLREPWLVPAELDASVPMLAGRELAWRVVEADAAR